MARLTIDSLKDVREALFDVRNSWYDIGVELDVSPATLDNIKTQFHDNAGHCLREMLKVWLKGVDCSWKVIVAALKSKALRESTGTLATEIEKEYCTETAASKGALSTTGNSQEGMVSELQAELRKLKSEVGALKTQRKLDQADLALATEPFQSGIDISAKTSFIVTSDKEHLFEMKGFGLRLHILEGSLPPGVTETELHVQASLLGKYCLPEGSELASAVYWLSVPVKISRPVTVEIQHNAAFEDPSSNLSFAICKFPEGRQPLLSCTFEKLEGGMFIRSSRNGSINLSSFSGLAIIMPKGSPQHYLSQLWYAKKSERDFSAYYVITRDLAALKSAVQACYSDEASQGHCERIDFEGDQIMMDLPMNGIKTEQWKISPVYYPVIHKEDAKSFSSGRLPVCELAIHWGGRYAWEMPPRLTYAINLLGAKGASGIVLDIEQSAFDVYVLKLFYSILDDTNCDVYCAVAKSGFHSSTQAQEKFIMELGAVEGPEMEFTFESHIVSMQLPAAVPGWKIIQPMPKLQISKAQARYSYHQFRVVQDTNVQEPLNMDVLLEGVKSPNNFIRVLLDPSVWGAQKRIALSQQLEQRNKEKRRQGHDPKGREERETELSRIKSDTEELIRRTEKRETELPKIKSDTEELIRRTEQRETELPRIKSDTEELIRRTEQRETELFRIKFVTEELIRRTEQRETELSRIKSDTEELIRRTEKRETKLPRIKSDTEELIRRTEQTYSGRSSRRKKKKRTSAQSSGGLQFHHTLRRSESTPEVLTWQSFLPSSITSDNFDPEEGSTTEPWITVRSHRQVRHKVRFQTYKSLIQNIAEQLGPRDVQFISYLTNLLHTHHQCTALEVLQELEKRGLFSQHKLQPLSNLLRRIDRNDLINNHVEPYLVQ